MPSLLCLQQIRHILFFFFVVSMLGEGGGCCLLNYRLDFTGLLSTTGNFLVIQECINVNLPLHIRDSWKEFWDSPGEIRYLCL